MLEEATTFFVSVGVGGVRGGLFVLVIDACGIRFGIIFLAAVAGVLATLRTLDLSGVLTPVVAADFKGDEALRLVPFLFFS